MTYAAYNRLIRLSGCGIDPRSTGKYRQTAAHYLGTADKRVVTAAYQKYRTVPGAQIEPLERRREHADDGSARCTDELLLQFAGALTASSR